MTAIWKLLGCAVVLPMVLGTGVTAAEISSLATFSREPLERGETLSEDEGLLSFENRHGQSSASDCSPSLLALLPTPSQLGYGVGEVTGRGCRNLIEVAATLDDPERAIVDLSAWGWIANAYQTVENGTWNLRVSIHRFETEEGAARALEAFGSLANEPARTEAIARSQLEPNQRALRGGDWGALVEQDGVMVTRVSFLCRCDAPGPLLTHTLAIMAALRSSWASGDATGGNRAAAPEVILAPEADSDVGRGCVTTGSFACAKENFESAYASAKDPQTKSDLYEFDVLNGDVWQQLGDLGRARQAYGDAVQLDPSRHLAGERLGNLRDYAAVELFDFFRTFNAMRGPHPHEAFVAGTTVPGWGDAHWSHVPLSAEYAVVAEVPAESAATVGLSLTRGPVNDGHYFMIDPLLKVWWIDFRNPDQSWSEIHPRTSYSALLEGPVERLEVRVVGRTPAFIVNGTELTAQLDLSGLPIPASSYAGVAVATVSDVVPPPISEVLSSFGIYRLGPEAGALLASMLPSEADVPAGLGLAQEGQRTADEITSTFPDPGDAAQRFNEWGWQENAFRDFASPDGATKVSVSLHRFADAESAAEALPYFMESRRLVSGPEFEPIDVAEIGEQVEAIEGPIPGGREMTLYVRQGNVLARISTVVGTGDALPVAVATAITVLSNIGLAEPTPPGPEHRG